MSSPLSGKTVALAEGRQLEDLAQFFAREGATAIRCPLLSILDAPDPEPIVAWLRELNAGRFDLLILLTGEGLRRLMGVAERSGLRDETLQSLRQVHTLTRGPKPGQALKEIGLTPREVAPAPTTEGVISALKTRDLHGKTIGLQLYSEENPPLMEYLARAGAQVRAVLPYVYAPRTDDARVVELIGQLSGGAVDVIVFTSSPQVDRLFEVAVDNKRLDDLRAGLGRTCVAAVGPVVAENLRQREITVNVCPEQGWQMKNLVLHVRRALEGAGND